MQTRQNAKSKNANPTKYKRTIYKYDKTQKWQYTNAIYNNAICNMQMQFPVILQLGQNTNQESDKIQKDIIQIIENTKRQNTNVTKFKKKTYKCDKIQI